MVPLKPNELRRPDSTDLVSSKTLRHPATIRATVSTGARNDDDGADTIDDRCAFSLRG